MSPSPTSCVCRDVFRVPLSNGTCWTCGYGLPSTATDPASPNDRLAAAFDALLSLVVQKSMIGPGGTGHPYNLGAEHRVWALFGEWRAGAESVEEAQEALKDVIRAALIEQTGGADAA